MSLIDELLFMFLCSFVGEGMHDDATVVFAYYKEGSTDPTFIYIAYGLKEVKCWRNLIYFNKIDNIYFSFFCPFIFKVVVAREDLRVYIKFMPQWRNII